ncbi:MAG: MarR family transcriptional regulator [Spirochaetales bacterium]|nr:MarR family transcriptional regulator [Spirochaetales bacterium]
MKLDDSLINLIYEAHLLLKNFEESPRDFGTGEKLFASEIHTIVAIGNNEGCNLTMLANNLKVSKPAANKFVNRLLKNEYIKKGKAIEDKRDIVLSLTDKGKIAFNSHKVFTEQTFGPLFNIEEQLSEEEKKIIRSFLYDLKESFN